MRELVGREGMRSGKGRARGGVTTGGAGDGGTEGGVGRRAAPPLQGAAAPFRIGSALQSSVLNRWIAQAETRTAVTVVCSGLISSTQGTIKRPCLQPVKFSMIQFYWG